MFTPLRSGSLVDQISERVAEAAESGLLQPGQRLPNETEFAAAVGVSPLTIREALARLRSAKVVVTTRGRNGGSFISPESEPSVARAEERLRDTTRVQLTEISAHLEALATGCARAAARRAGPRDLDVLRTHVAADDDDPALWRRLETEFLVEVAAAGRIARLARALLQTQSEFGVLSFLPNTDATYRHGAADHRLLVINAIESRSESASEDTVRALVGHTTSWLLTRHATLI
ncbi:FadR/GntR family transcriptional regulator [Gordonia hydrophobica]|uniref:GntR family transcriptional regulator n=1 Tax=Gordonia hydrophobica TaxID=40516 RepID=A0ABZ2U557_9ACTN|nr:GntR family transcriptional regulator [Gordonia hydrophobica]MBM7368362.1 DNA-binding FadR family transcriptional regulator [Gordonia hydrophobica]